MALTKAQIRSIVETHKRLSEKERKDWDMYRGWYLSEYWQKEDDLPTGAGGPADSDEITFETNYLYAYLDTMIANVCPTNPQVSVYARQEKHAQAARFREALINEILKRNDIHTKLWKQSLSTGLCGRGWLKTVWDFRKQRPVTRHVDPRFVWYDRSVDYEDARYLIEVTVLTKDEMKARVKKRGPGKGQKYSSKVAEKAEYAGYPGWLKDKFRDKSMIDSASKEVYDWVVVYEFYDFVGGKYYHLLDGVEEPLFESELPYRLVKNPFRLLTFNDNMMDSGGVPDAKLVAGNIERLNEIDTLELRHTHSTIPVMLADPSKVDDIQNFLDMLRDADAPGMVALLEVMQGHSIHDVVGHTPVPTFAPEWGEMRQRAIDTIEFVLGIPAYSRGKVGVTDVATEAALADTAVRTRNGRRIKAVLDVVTGLAEDIMGLYEEFMPEDQELQIRLTGKAETLSVSREGVLAREFDEEGEVIPDSVLQFDYDAVAYSPTENHRLLQLEKIKQYLPVLLQHPAIDPQKLMTKLLELLQVPDLMVDQSQQSPAFNQAAQMQAAGMPPGGQPPTTGPEAPEGVDTIATGALPPGLEPINMPLPGGGPGSGQRMA